MFLDLLWYASKGMTKETTFSCRSDCCAVPLAFWFCLAGPVILFSVRAFALLVLVASLPACAGISAFRAVFVRTPGSLLALTIAKLFFSILALRYALFILACLSLSALGSATSAVIVVLLEVLPGLAFIVAEYGLFSRAFALAVLACLPTLALVSASSAVIVILLKVLRGLAFIATEHGLVGRALALPMLAYLSFLAHLAALAAVVNVLCKVGFLSVRAFASTTHALFSLLDVALISTS
jgi:hypothetical protein